MEKWMIVYMLPLEVWMDIFCFPWISRSEEFGQLVAQIGNFKFAEHAQFFLHEWGKRKLGDLTFKKKGCLYKLVDGRSYRLEHPQTPMPENIKSFDCIHIRHFDSNTLGFLAKIKPLLTDLKIVLRSIPASRQENLRTILANLASMLADGIRSVFCCDASTSFPLVKEQLFCENDEKLAKLKMLEINDVSYISEMQQQELIKFIMKWLIGQPDTNGQPRLLQFHSRPEFYEQMFKTIREQFTVAITPRTFAVNLHLYSWQERGVAEFHLKNGIGEELHGEWTGEHGDLFQITRHRAERNTQAVWGEWIEPMMTKGRDDRKICIYNPTVGPIDAAPQIDVPGVDEERGDDQQMPCSSKDA